MSRISKMAPGPHDGQKVVNFMGGTSYRLGPVDVLRMMAASSMFGEPTYYRKESSGRESKCSVNQLVEKYAVIRPNAGDTPSKLMLKAISESLDFDFGKTIELAAELRDGYLVRTVPQLIMAAAAGHPARPKFDEEHPGQFRRINLRVMRRADEPACQLSCWLYLHGWSKRGIPSVLKRSWKERVESMSAYEASKYKAAEAGLINLVRICHAKGGVVSDLMKDGKVEVRESDQTWENLRSAGMPFSEIVKRIRMPHMALLRNLRNLVGEGGRDLGFMKEVAAQLKAGVAGGRQFPFRYYAAMEALRSSGCPGLLLDALEECIDLSVAQLPRLRGRTMALSDNSGSAWGAFTSEYGSMTIAKIGNLSAVIAAVLSDDGYVGKFGDGLKVFPASRRNGLLSQAEEISKDRFDDVGGSTENGIWTFFKEAIEKGEKWDNIFIFSDQQAGHGGLYGEGDSYVIDGEKYNVCHLGFTAYVDVMKLLERYRSKVNPKVNFFTVQTAGYDDALIPELVYRGAVLCGWTGKETLFAQRLISQWDCIEQAND